jgi:mannose-6-phosphate isomerase-like protein (cupin superfamily)
VSNRSFETKILPATSEAVAPDGSDVRVLLATTRASLAHFQLQPRETSVAVRHRSVEEIWYCLGGRGEMWRRFGGHEQTVELRPGLCVTIPPGTAFQFRAWGESAESEGAAGERAFVEEPLSAIGATMPPWPGAGEAVIVDGPWEPTVPPGPN